MSRELVLLRKKEWIKILDSYPIKVIICEGFPFCRHQFSHEYFSFFEEAKKHYSPQGTLRISKTLWELRTIVGGQRIIFSELRL